MATFDKIQPKSAIKFFWQTIFFPAPFELFGREFGNLAALSLSHSRGYYVQHYSFLACLTHSRPPKICCPHTHTTLSGKTTLPACIYMSGLTHPTASLPSEMWQLKGTVSWDFWVLVLIIITICAFCAKKLWTKASIWSNWRYISKKWIYSTPFKHSTYASNCALVTKTYLL